MTIIFDFNRTLYDPETATLLPGAPAVLAHCVAQGHTLHLVSRREPGREGLLATLGIESFFASATFAEDKGEVLAMLIRTGAPSVYVIGDHLHDEIRTGSRCGARTIWLRRGRFSDLVPEEGEEPWRTITELPQLIPLLS